MSDGTHIYQVVLKRAGPGMGEWFDRPFSATADRWKAGIQLEEAKKTPMTVEAVLLVGESMEDLEDQYSRFKRGRSTQDITPEGEKEQAAREALEMAPLRDEYPLPAPVPPLSSFVLTGDQYHKLIHLMLETAEGKRGGANDGTEGPKQ